METDPRVKRNLALLVDHMAAETSAPDVKVISHTVADEVCYRFLGSSPDGADITGREAAERFSEEFLERVGTDVEFVVEHIVAGPDCVALQGVLRRQVDEVGSAAIGAHFRFEQTAGSSASTRLIQSHMAVFYRFDHAGLIVGKDMYASLR